MVEIEAVIVQLCIKEKFKNAPSVEDWELAKGMVDALEPLYNITVQMSSETHTTVSKVLPLTNSLKKIYSSKDDDDLPLVADFKEAIYESLCRRFSWLETRVVTAVSCLVDPRFKDRVFSGGPSSVKKAKMLLKKEMAKEANETLGAEQAALIETNVNEPPKKKKKNDIWSFIDDEIELHEKTLKIHQAANTPDKFDDEMNSYFGEKNIPVNEDPFIWWIETGQKKYPYIYEVAMNLLIIQATSVASERVFSDAGNVYNKKRSRLGVDIADKIIMLHKNLTEDMIP